MTDQQNYEIHIKLVVTFNIIITPYAYKETVQF